MSYASLDQFHNWSGGDAPDDADASQRVLNAVDAAINEHCGRVFTLDTAATARHFTALNAGCCLVDDFDHAGLTEIAFDYAGTNATWTVIAEGLGSEILAEPLDRRTDLAIERLVAGTKNLPGGSYRVRVTATWGWPKIPEQVVEASLLLAHRQWRRQNSPEGVASGFGEPIRVAAKLDPDAERLLQPLVHPRKLGISV